LWIELNRFEKFPLHHKFSRNRKGSVVFWQPLGLGVGCVVLSQKQQSNFDGSEDAGVFDHVHFAQYTMHDADLEREILGLFLVQLQDVSTQLSVAMTAQDWRFMVHTLKGSAATVGAGQLHDLARRWEREAGSPDPIALAGHQHAFEAACLTFRNVARNVMR
jgi:HPt (histidine-containing phosphotransfer) domain-containing protein